MNTQESDLVIQSSNSRIDAAVSKNQNNAPTSIAAVNEQQSKSGQPSPESYRKKHQTGDVVDQELQEKCKGWSEIRCKGSLPDRRSYHTLSQIQNILIIYGGYDIRQGDWGNLFVLDLCNEPQWRHMQLDPSVPKSICRHTSVVYDNKLWVLGGESKFNSVNDFFTIQLETFKVNHLKTNVRGAAIFYLMLQKEKFKAPRFLDSHTAIVQESATDDMTSDKMIVFGGYNHSHRSNKTYIYSFINNSWEEVDYKNNENLPCERTGHSAELYQQSMYIFGGTDPDNNKLNDLWKFDINAREWTQIEYPQQTPFPQVIDILNQQVQIQARSGHGSAMIDGKMYIFGGILGMTHQLNDLWAYDFASNTWKELHDQLETWKLHSPLRNKKTVVKEEMQQSSGKLKALIRGRGTEASTFYDKKETSFKIRESHSQNPIRQNAKKKLSKNRHSYIDLASVPQKIAGLNNLASPTTVALKNTLLFRSSQIGINSSTISSQDSLSRKKTKVNLYKGPKQPSSGLIEGFPPCPRDGLAMVADKKKKKFYIFGGDRYQMAYNDLYEFDVSSKN